jgi:uncharacterized protein YoxC
VDHVNASFGGPLDILVAVALIFLAVSLMAVSLPLMSMVKQSERTLSALERLLGTVNQELGPTLKQVDALLGTVLELKTTAEKRITEVGSKVGDVKGGLNKFTGEAKKQSSVFGAGLYAGVRSYLERRPEKGSRDQKDEMRLSEVGKR